MHGMNLEEGCTRLEPLLPELRQRQLLEVWEPPL